VIDDCMIYIAYAVAVAIRSYCKVDFRLTTGKKRGGVLTTYQHIPVSPLLHIVDQFSLCLKVVLQMFNHLVVQRCE